MVNTGSLSRIALLVLMVASLAGCEVIGGIFKAGVWVGALGVVIVAVLLIFVVGKMRG